MSLTMSADADTQTAKDLQDVEHAATHVRMLTLWISFGVGFGKERIVTITDSSVTVAEVLDAVRKRKSAITQWDADSGIITVRTYDRTDKRYVQKRLGWWSTAEVQTPFHAQEVDVIDSAGDSIAVFKVS